MELTDGVNWLAVVVGFVLSFILGWLWYSPKVFGRVWAKGVGVDIDAPGPVPVMALLLQALSAFGLSWLFGITAAKDSLLTIILVVVTIMLFVAANGKFAKKSNTALLIEAGYIFAMSFIMLMSQAIL